MLGSIAFVLGACFTGGVRLVWNVDKSTEINTPAGILRGDRGIACPEVSYLPPSALGILFSTRQSNWMINMLLYVSRVPFRNAVRFAMATTDTPSTSMETGGLCRV